VSDDAASRREELGSFIRTRRRDHRLSLRRLSQASGISNPYLSQIERGLRKPSAEVLQQIARALDLPVEELYVRAGILESAGDGGLVSLIRRDPDLTDDQKATLVRLYDEFRAAAKEEPAAG